MRMDSSDFDMIRPQAPTSADF